MLRINFTTHVLGPLAALRLKQEKVTQTLRAKDSLIAEVILSGEVKVGDQIRIALNNRMLGIAKLSIFDPISWTELDINDAHRGGFDSLPDLGLALKRAGYRFKTLDGYTFYRIQFRREVPQSDGCRGQVALDPGPSQKLYNHSPEGFQWGYGGSGPAQLALALLLDVTGDGELSVALHQHFKRDFVATWGESWEMDADQIRRWVELIRQ